VLPCRTAFPWPRPSRRSCAARPSPGWPS